MFEIGQMVVHIVEPRNSPAAVPLNAIVTISGFCHRHDDDIGLFFEEVPRIGGDGWCECHDPRSYRPVRKTSIEELRKLVAPIKTKERA